RRGLRPADGRLVRAAERTPPVSAPRPARPLPSGLRRRAVVGRQDGRHPVGGLRWRRRRGGGGEGRQQGLAVRVTARGLSARPFSAGCFRLATKKRPPGGWGGWGWEDGGGTIPVQSRPPPGPWAAWAFALNSGPSGGRADPD